ncbi:hypothetical protein WAI453_002262 [Rhynchosporium graminicola]|uniref:Uncharacterized protein n=1 Tax=Rhynchosporium graminicola TaxID=2792576 RepID=A0A1E1LC52_9HELO|nr:uncharacterized protein RCO7_09565 [Rhynchosporium commune]
MKSFAFVVSGLAFACVAKAASCSASNAERVTVNTGSNGGGSNGGGSGGGGGGGGGFVPNRNACYDLETLEWQCDIVYRRLTSRRSLMTLSKRDGLDCTSSEACISLEGEISCYNPTTDDFHVEDGTKGNFRTGDYLLPDGQAGNLFNGPFPTPLSSTGVGASRTTVRSSDAASSTKSGDATVFTTLADSASKSSNPTATLPAGVTTTSNSATATPNSGHQKQGRGHWVGAGVGLAGLLAL